MNPILITGGARRLGAAMARALAAAGYPVIIHAHQSGPEAEALGAELSARVILGDLGDPVTPARLIEEAGPLSGLINNASHFVFDNPASTTAEVIASHMAPNLVAPVLLAQAFAAQAPAQGVIINILDQKLTNLNPDFFAYTLTKAALAAATDMMAQAFAPNIRVCGISPGLTLPGPKQTVQKFERAWRANPLRRGATPEDIAAAALFIITTPSITGTTITVDGGEHLTHRPRDVAFLAPE
ncbi:MAG TPA: SDR family oxidoreductase [Acidocella sp.]|nr:SDR family oxidoreductase [Acidocella sp.]